MTVKTLAIRSNQPYQYFGLETSTLWNKVWWNSEFGGEIVLNFVQGNVGLVGNELAYQVAKRAGECSSISNQDKACWTLWNFKCYSHKITGWQMEPTLVWHVSNSRSLSN